MDGLVTVAMVQEYLSGFEPDLPVVLTEDEAQDLPFAGDFVTLESVLAQLRNE